MKQTEEGKIKLRKTTILATCLLISPDIMSAETVYVSSLSVKQRRNLHIAQETFIKYPDLVKVAFCESSLEHTEKDGTVKRGDVDPRDTGLMQINKGYHLSDAKALGLNLEIMNDNMRYALFLRKNQGLKPWKASRHCWQNLYLVSK